MIMNQLMMFYDLQKFLSATYPGYKKSFLEIFYYYKFHRHLNLKTPRTFNEKLQWLKLYGGYERYTLLADKCRAKEIIKSQIAEEYIVPTILCTRKIDQISFFDLPESFVIKPTHTSGDIVICKDKASLDLEKMKRIMEQWLGINYYWFESVYKNIEPRILFENRISNGGTPLFDYKFYCFNGKVHFVHVDLDRFTNHKRNFYSRNWVLWDFSLEYPNSNEVIRPPQKLDEMILIAEKISRGFPFIRVDLYYYENKIYFGELTFFPESGFGRFDPQSTDFLFGDLFELPISE